VPLLVTRAKESGSFLSWLSCLFSTKTNIVHVFESQISGAAQTTTRAVHAARAAMIAAASCGAETRARKRKQDLDVQVGIRV